jgi:hypothetical protein
MRDGRTTEITVPARADNVLFSVDRVYRIENLTENPADDRILFS